MEFAMDSDFCSWEGAVVVEGEMKMVDWNCVKRSLAAHGLICGCAVNAVNSRGRGRRRGRD